MTYPKDDEQFEVTVIKKVDETEGGWIIVRDDGWSFVIPDSSPVLPLVGMGVRFYGKGVGYPVRGLFLDGQKVFYRTEAEEVEHREIETYGADAADWLRRWDAGRSVWSIEMGGLGPGYEQAIQITAAEVLRHLLEQQYDSKAWESKDTWDRDLKQIREAGFKNQRIDALGLSGAQWGAAVGLATSLYMHGPRGILKDSDVKDRLIQVSRSFPSVP